MKKLIAIFLFVTFVSIPLVWADPWAVVANRNDRTIHTIDLGTVPPTVHGPFLAGQLGDSGMLLDVAVTPNGRYALVSNFTLNTVYRIDLSDPANPALAGTIDIGFLAEDIAISPNGNFALVTDGTFENRLAIIDLSTFILTTVYTLTTAGALAQAVAIAPDNQTVIICDWLNDRIIYGVLNPNTGLTSETTLPTGEVPINVTISPDGQTALVANAWDNTVSVFQITGPGTVAAGTTPTVGGLPGLQQSIAFSPDGQRAYVISTDPSPDQLSWLQINSPGNVTLGGAGVSDLLSDTSGGFWGVDVLAVTPDGSYALAGNPSDDGAANDVAMIALSTWAVTSIDTDSDFPVGIDTFGQYQPPSIPMLSEWGMIVLFILLAGSALWVMRRRQRTV